jgi:hypothetical protein
MRWRADHEEPRCSHAPAGECRNTADFLNGSLETSEEIGPQVATFQLILPWLPCSPLWPKFGRPRPGFDGVHRPWVLRSTGRVPDLGAR